MTRDEYFREKEIIALESIAESLKKLADLLPDKNESEPEKQAMKDIYKGMEVSHL